MGAGGRGWVGGVVWLGWLFLFSPRPVSVAIFAQITYTIVVSHRTRSATTIAVCNSNAEDYVTDESHIQEAPAAMCHKEAGSIERRRRTS